MQAKMTGCVQSLRTATYLSAVIALLLTVDSVVYFGILAVSAVVDRIALPNTLAPQIRKCHFLWLQESHQ